MSFVASLFGWGNAVYTFALVTTLGFALLQVSGLLGWLAGAEDTDHDGDHDGGDHDGGDHDGDGDDDNDQASTGGLLATMGAGRIPLSMIWQTFGITFALSGLAINTAILVESSAVPTWSLVVTLPVSMVTAFFVTRAAGLRLGHLLVSDATQASSRANLVGRSAVVISSQLSTSFGEVRIKDKGSHVRVVCKLQGGPPVIEGTEVVIVECIGGQLYAAPLDVGLAEARSAPAGHGLAP